MKQSEKMYGNAPKLERDEQDGKVKVKKSEEKAPEGKEANGGGEGIEVLDRHSMERMDLHHKHQHEHHTHDHGKHPEDKKELHARHEEEVKMLYKKHEKELGGKK